MAAQILRKNYKLVVTTVKLSYLSISNELFQAGLLTDDVKAALGLNTTDQVKANKIVDCVRSFVENDPDKIDIFIDILRRNTGTVAAERLESELQRKGWDSGEGR